MQDGSEPFAPVYAPASFSTSTVTARIEQQRRTKTDPTLTIVEAALASGEPDFARQAAERLLEVQPGHLEASVALARTLLVLGQLPVAEAQLGRVVQSDPEDLAAWRVLAQIREARGQRVQALSAAAAALVLCPQDARLQALVTALAGGHAPAWLAPVVQARAALDQGRFAEARSGAAASYAYALDPLPALIQLEAAWRQADLAAARRAAEHLLAERPRLVQPRLILAECLLASGTPERAVALLHEAAGLDPAGQVAARLWGPVHRFESIWPVPLESAWDEPLPGPVAAALGWNVLPPGAGFVTPPNAAGGHASHAGQGDTQPLPAVQSLQSARQAHARLVADVVKDIRGELRRLSHSPKPKLAVAQAHVILTSKRRLIAKYGPEGFARVESLLKTLEAATFAAHPESTPGVIFVDDVTSLREFDLNPVDPQHPWAVKRLLGDLDIVIRHTTKERSQLGSLLIVGGDDVIAHHRLPNPADDADLEVLSDNPYAARDDNYFVTERAVGRIPDGAGDLAALCRALEAAIAAHRAPPVKPSWTAWLWQQLRRWLGRWLPPAPEQGEALGYSASVWRRASLAVFEVIGDARRMRICPPTTFEDFARRPEHNGGGALDLEGAAFAYFNLHGLPDAPEWYGQRDPQMPAGFPAFPVALRPQDLNGKVPRVVYSEACYGGAVSGRTAETAMALRLLSGGAQAVVVSTAVAYGGVATPLLGADLLGRLFWQELAKGISTGEALRRAKLGLAHIMQQRQGVLDGEDQKTLISFVLYGDPSVCPRVPRPPDAREVEATKIAWEQMAEEPALVCSKGATSEAVFDAPVDLITQVKQEVAHYLPGMEGAELRMSKPHSCRGKRTGHECPAQTLGAREDNNEPLAARERIHQGQLVFTLKKTFRAEDHLHARIVRVTASREGQVIKLAVSR